VDGLDLGIALIGADHRIIMANMALAKMLNTSGDALAGKNCLEVFEKRHAVCTDCPATIAIRSGRTYEAEREAIRDDSKRIKVRIRAIPIVGEDGSVSGVVEVVEDVTER